MSADLPPGFHALGLVHDATRNDVRKAYSAQLKQINPDIDPAAFEKLRAAYEAALRFVEAPRAAPAPPPPAMADSTPFRLDADDGLVAQPEDRAEKALQDATTGAIEALTARIHSVDAEKNEVMRIIGVLHDPAMNDPQVARAVEHEIYSFLLGHIGENDHQEPEFRFAWSKQPHFNANREAVGHLLRRLDRQFGWLSDGVRMEREFWDYDTFVAAVRMLQAPPVQTAPVQRNPFEHWAGMWIIMVLLSSLVGCAINLWEASERRASSPPSPLIGYTGEIADDATFLVGFNGPNKPSKSTRTFLSDLAQEQLGGETMTSVKLLVLRNNMIRLYEGKVAPGQFKIYTNPERFQYLLGVFLATREALVEGLSYRDIARFHLIPQAGSEMALWTNTQEISANPGLWHGNGGYSIESGADVPQTAYVAVYPPKFLTTMLRAANGNARALEGALGLSFRFFEHNPDARVLYYPEVDFPEVQDAPVSLQRHGLVRTGLGENRWPIRAILPRKPLCKWSTTQLLDPEVAWRCVPAAAGQ